MAGLTVTEKTHWIDRIGRRIDKRIEAIYAEEPNLNDRIQRDARQRALESLGLAEQQAELDQIERQKDELDKHETRIQRAMLAHVRGVPVDEVDGYQSYRYDHEVTSAVQLRRAVHEEELLAESERGRKILELRREKEDLLDTVWLACSIKQVKDLWQRVAEVLGDQPTPLQQDALNIEPIDND